MFISDLCMIFITQRFFVYYLYKIINFCRDFVLTFVPSDGIIIQYCSLMQHFFTHCCLQIIKIYSEVTKVKGKNKRRFNKFVSVGLITTLTASFCVGIMQSPIADTAILSSFAAEASTDEICYEFNKSESTLTLSGNIEMSDFTEQDSAPWSEYSDSTEKIVIEEGIKSVGSNAFVSFSDLGEVTIPQSVTKISDSAFVDCKDGFTVKGMSDSAAYTFAQSKQYKFEALDAVSDSDALLISESTTTTTTSAPVTTTTTTTTVPADPTIPTNVAVTCTAYNKLKISWNKVDGADGYYLYCANSENGKYTIAKYITSGDVTEFIHSSRSYEKTYYYKLRSYTVEGKQKVFSPDSEIASGMTHVDPPAPVKNVSVVCTDYNKLTISWDQVEEAAGYYVYWATDPDGKYTLAKNITRGTVTQFVHSGRAYEKTYYYKVSSYTKAGSKTILADYSEIVSGMTHIDPPAAVENVKVTCTAYNQLSISWDKVDNAKGYYVYWSDAADGKYSLVKNVTRNTTTTALHSRLKLGMTYYYKVVSYNKAGSKSICADESAVVSGKTYLHTPAAPTVTAKNDTYIYITLTKVSGALKYNLYRSVDGGEFTQIAVITSRYTDKNTIPGKTYAYKLAAVRGDVVTDCSPAASAVGIINTPTLSKAYSDTYNTATVKWKSVSNATEYNIYRSTEENGDYTCIGTVNSRTLTFTSSNLDTGTEYYFKVTAGKTLSGETGYSDMSNAKSATPALKSVSKISGSSVGKSAIFVEWSNVAGADGYELFAAKSDESMALLEDCDKYYYSHKELSTGDKYSYQVRAYRLINGSKVYSSYSKTVSVTVPKTLSTSTYSWSYSNKVVNNQTPDDLIKSQEKANNIKTLFVGDTTRKVIYLTMDCGYPTENSDTNLDTLKEKNVKATFFIALPYAKESHAQIQRMIDEGHIIGNHTKNHIRLNRATHEVIENQVKTLENYIYDNFNYRTKYFRYPYGSFSQASQNELIEMGYISAGWSFAYNDYSRSQPKPANALNLLVKNIHPGAIFLLHMDSSTNTTILGDFIDKAREMGYEFENLDDIEI